MKKYLILFSILIGQLNSQNMIPPPVATKIPKKLEIHGDIRIDNYYWMNDRTNKKVVEHLNAENAYTKGMLSHTEKFQAKLFNEMVGRIKQTDLSVPYKMKGYWYYVRYEEGKEYPIYCRKKETMDAKEEIMLDVNEMAKGSDYYDVAGLSVSPDNMKLAYGVDNVSRRQYTMYIKDLSTGKTYTETVKNTDGSYVWANDNKTIFYDVKDEQTLRTYLIKKHLLGTDQKNDKNVYEERDETFGCSVYKSRTDDMIMIGCYSTQTSETWYLDASEPDGAFRQVIPRMKDHLYSAEYFKGYFYITSNYNAKNFQLVRLKEGGELDNFEIIIPHDSKVLIENFELFRNFIAVSERKDGLLQIRILEWDFKTMHYLDFSEEAYTAYTSTNPDFDTDVLRYSFTSLVTPNSVYDYNMKTKKKTLLKQQEVVGGYEALNYKSIRSYAKTQDGKLVYYSMVYKNDVKITPRTPLLIYGYGSYGASMDPYFSSTRLSLLDRGFVFVIAHIRGGQELGREWYEDGKLLNKKHTFEDFISVTETLHNNGISSPSHTYAMGGSAGGLLMGAVMNMRPDLYNGIVAQVPFVDVVTTMLDESIPLTTGEFDEWGNPKNKEYYEYIKTYSPYDNVAKGLPYPNLLVTTGFHDSQVQYWEPAKWVAKLREEYPSDKKLLLWCEMEAGHGGKSGRFERLKEIALEYAFLLDLEGINE